MRSQSSATRNPPKAVRITCGTPRSGWCRFYFHRGRELFAVLDVEAAILPDKWPGVSPECGAAPETR